MRHIVAAAALLAAACTKPVQKTESHQYSDRRDYHSYSNPEEVRVTHVALDLDVRFESRTLQGTAILNVQLAGKPRSATVILDTRDLTIRSVEAASDGVQFKKVEFSVGARDAVLGSPLRIDLPPAASQVRVSYETSPGATGLQWLSPQQTAGKRSPFLYSQSQAIHARSWIPVQDSPGVRVTYSAKIRTPKDLVAVMSAQSTGPVSGGEYAFDMPQAIPAYLIALAVGNLEFRPVSTRSGVWAEPPVLEKAAKEFEDLEKMMRAAESLYGAYQWRRYDVLVLPPSFPFGGMENPKLTFVTPTLLAGDKSLVGVIAHELAHSWSGNLVTNATWRDFWLNEGFTTYFENRIQEQVYGPERALMEAQLERQSLEDEMRDLPEGDEVLYIDLKGRDPDDGATQVPYVKGMLLLRRMEELYGRETFDGFLRRYFGQFAFQSITTGEFVNYLQTNLLTTDSAAAAKLQLDEWLTRPGLPADAPKPQAQSLATVRDYAAAWLAGKRALSALPTAQWSTQEWLGFLTALPRDLSRPRMAELDQAFRLTGRANSEIRFQWLLMSIRAGYTPAFDDLDRFLMEVGRRKYIRPLYTELAKTPDGRKRAEAVYRKARPGYHPVAQMSIDEVLKAK